MSRYYLVICPSNQFGSTSSPNMLLSSVCPHPVSFSLSTTVPTTSICPAIPCMILQRSSTVMRLQHLTLFRYEIKVSAYSVEVRFWSFHIRRKTGAVSFKEIEVTLAYRISSLKRLLMIFSFCSNSRNLWFLSRLWKAQESFHFSVPPKVSSSMFPSDRVWFFLTLYLTFLYLLHWFWKFS